MKNLNRIFKRVTYFLFALVVLGSCSGRKNGEAGPVAERAPQTHIVEIRQMVFSPAEIKVKKGDSITFINHDLVAHDITEASSKAWTSSPLQPEQSWKLKVTASANYYCSLHAVMKGKIIVE
ncbi:plastocyanin/azurin family copper-binding protein [Danxiaibacter flavus]|uniref:Plastocyanin/azurin family copper-binding protein n=1 Tax=Danxiaibacter flavus TaxID=3049108 RepID=A0ABV3ZNB0_9BACT|nr:plastocyanin/azurin family copper-binding protein [Chitinophagaceae bacterium DXS]